MLLYTVRGTLAVLLLSTLAVGQWSVPEEQDPGAYLGNVRAAVVNDYDQSVLDNLTFTLTGDSAPFFDLDPSSGDVRTRVKIDREALPNCEESATCELNVEVEVGPRQYFRILRHSVTVVDVNDNAPEFSAPVAVLYLPESWPPGTLLEVNPATDPDSPEFGLMEYRIIDPSSMFAVSLTEPEVFLELTSQPDYEQQQYHEVELWAYDGGSPPRTSSQLLNISVVDVNDNPPVFEPDLPLTLSVSEDTTGGTQLYQLSASDVDTGPGGEVRYKLATSSQAAHGAIFSVNATSGWLTLEGTLDREQHPEYLLTIVAENLDESYPQSSQVTLTIIITDVNDHPPVMQVTVLAETNQNGHLLLQENVTPGKPLLYVIVYDPDEGSSGQVTCHADGYHVTVVQQSAGRFTLETAAIIDRETISMFTVNLTCTDNPADDVTSLSTSRTFMVEVQDANDNAPEFTQDSYFTALVETSEAGSSVVDVTARDSDTGPNADITYTLAEADQQLFTISESQGTVYLRDSLPENGTYLNVTVTATDHGSGFLSTSTFLLIKIIRIHTEPPQVEQFYLTFTVVENNLVGYVLGRLPLILEHKEEIQYMTFTTNDRTGLFGINSTSANLLCTTQLDREDSDVYTFDVQVQYVGQVVHSVVHVSVSVEDVNDNSPVLIFPTPDNRTVEVLTTTPKQTLLTTIIARDPDSGPNGELTYNLVYQNQAGHHVTIDRDNGHIYLARDLSTSGINELEVAFRVDDKGTPQHTIHGTLIFTIAPPGSPPGTTDPTTEEKSTPIWIYVLGGAAGVVVIILIIVITVVRRQCSADRKYKDIERKLESIERNNNSERTSLAQERSSIIGRIVGPGVGSDRVSDSYIGRIVGSEEGVERTMEGSVARSSIASDGSNGRRVRYAGALEGLDSGSEAGSDSGRGSNTSHTWALLPPVSALCRSYIPEDSVYTSAHECPHHPRTHGYPDRLGGPASHNSSHVPPQGLSVHRAQSAPLYHPPPAKNHPRRNLATAFSLDAARGAQDDVDYSALNGSAPTLAMHTPPSNPPLRSLSHRTHRDVWPVNVDRRRDRTRGCGHNCSCSDHECNQAGGRFLGSDRSRNSDVTYNRDKQHRFNIAVPVSTNHVTYNNTADVSSDATKAKHLASLMPDSEENLDSDLTNSGQYPLTGITSNVDFVSSRPLAMGEVQV